MPAQRIRRELGTMIVYGYARSSLEQELSIAGKIGAEVLEILPDWRSDPDPSPLGRRIADSEFSIHSAHGCWGGQATQADYVDLGSLDRSTWNASLDDLKRCVDWLRRAGGRYLVIHPGGLSDPADFVARRAALTQGLGLLASHAEGSGIVVCVENMPPGVYPGSRMEDLAEIVDEVGSASVALALDTGHAFLSREPSTGDSRAVDRTTVEAGQRLATTHVHDNDGRRDDHRPPGLGNIDWKSWVDHLDQIGYRGPIMLECIRKLRQDPALIDEVFLGRLRKMIGLERW